MSISTRYSRQLLFDGIGQTGQQRLLASKVVVIGCGALGALQLEILARAGVGAGQGRLRAIDRDFVEYSNLQRQVMYNEQDAQAQLPKVIAAREHIKQVNPEVNFDAIIADVNHTNIEALIADADLVLDGTDNFETRFLINDACVKHNKPWIYAAAVAAQGLTMTILPQQTACLRCVFEQLPPPGSAPTCDTAGVILPIISTIVGWQTAEAFKILVGQRDQLHGGLLQLDLWQGTQSRINLAGLRERADCRCCSQHHYDFLQAAQQALLTTLCGRNAVQITPAGNQNLDLSALAERLRASGEVSLNKFLLRFKTSEHEITVFADARSIIHGTKDERQARSLYARYIGV